MYIRYIKARGFSKSYTNPSYASSPLCIVVCITIITYAPNQIIQNAIATNTTSTSSTSTNGNKITLGTPQVYTEYAKTTGFRPAIVNGTHGIQISFTGHDILLAACWSYHFLSLSPLWVLVWVLVVFLHMYARCVFVAHSRKFCGMINNHPFKEKTEYICVT